MSTPKNPGRPGAGEPNQSQFEDVLKRMLSSPPKQHKDERVKPKPAVKTAQKKPAK